MVGLADYLKKATVSPQPAVKPAALMPGITPLPEGERPTTPGISDVPTYPGDPRLKKQAPTPVKPPPGITPLPEGETPTRPIIDGQPVEPRDPAKPTVPPVKPPPGGGITPGVPEHPGDPLNPRPPVTPPVTPTVPGVPNPSPAVPRAAIADPQLTAMPTGTVQPAASNPTAVARTDPADPAAKAKAYEAWLATVSPERNESVADALARFTAQDSEMMQLARTQGLQAANRRGLINSSMAVGAMQDEVLRSALPVAQQDAAQAAAANMQGRDFKYDLAKQFSGQEFQGDQAAINRALDQKMQNASLNAADQQQVRDILSREGLAAADSKLQQIMQDKGLTATANENAKNRTIDQRMQNASLDAADQQQIRDIISRQGMQAAEQTMTRMENEKNRALDLKMQDTQISAAERQQIRDIASREGQAAADRALTELQQQREIEYQKVERGLDRETQTKLASWNLKSSDRNSAAQLLSNMEASYNEDYRSIMANTALTAEQRTAQLAGAQRMRDTRMGLIEQMYGIELDWGQSGGTTPTPPPGTTPIPEGETPTPPPRTGGPTPPVIPPTPTTPVPVTPRTPATRPGGGRNS